MAGDVRAAESLGLQEKCGLQLVDGMFLVVWFQEDRY